MCNIAQSTEVWLYFILVAAGGPRYAFDQIEDAEPFEKVRGRVENIYSNIWLYRTVPKWNQSLTQETMDHIGMIKQERFFEHYLRPYDGKERVIVIISDAFRYECAVLEAACFHLPNIYCYLIVRRNSWEQEFWVKAEVSVGPTSN